MNKKTTHILSFTYKEKEAKILDGTCTQTIRRVGNRRRIHAGDFLLLHGWQGKPRHSKWSWRKKVVVKSVESCHISEEGILFCNGGVCALHGWSGDVACEIAERDGIVPPTGEELKKVLMTLNGPKWKGDYLIIRWREIEGDDTNERGQL